MESNKYSLQLWLIVGLLALIVGYGALQVWWVQATTLDPDDIVEVRP